MSFTKTGKYVRSGMLKNVMMNANTVRASIELCRRRNWMPCFRLLKIDSVVGAGRNLAVISDSEMIGARNDTALSPKHHLSPSLASVIPASEGPMVTARLNWIEFSAIALGISSRSTNVGISAEYAGPPNACAKPFTHDKLRICQT